MNARVVGAIGAVAIVGAAGYLAMTALEAAWSGMKPQAPVATLELDPFEDAAMEEPVAPVVPETGKPGQKAAPGSGASLAVAANMPRASGTLGKGGTIYWVHGETVQGPGGESAQRSGNTTYVQAPGEKLERYETFGTTTYGPNGIVAQRSGSSTYVTGPDGRVSMCTTVGAQSDC